MQQSRILNAHCNLKDSIYSSSTGFGGTDNATHRRHSECSRIEDLAYASSPSAHIEKWRGPTLLTFGDLDTLGHAESVIDLGYRLLERGVPVEFYVDPAGGHNVFPQDRVFEFFERSLKK